MDLAEQVPWWVDKVAVPVAFTLIGALIGFVVGQAKEWLDSRRAKASFLAAIRLELESINEQLSASLEVVEAGRERFSTNQGAPPILAGTLRTTVFTTQLARLRDLSDPLVISVVKFYSDIGVLEQLINHLNNLAEDSFKAQAGEQQKAVSKQIVSALLVLSEQIRGFQRRTGSLLLALSPADTRGRAPLES